jgi:CHAT domain-containing protein
LQHSGEVASRKAQVYGTHDSDFKHIAENNALKAQLTAARERYEAFRKDLYTRHPQLAVSRGELAALKIEELRPLVDTNTALLQYAVSDEKVFLFVVTGPVLDVKVYAINMTRNEIAQKVASFRKSIDNPSAARELYDLLLKPAESQIAQRSKLIIVPDGALWDVPFEALQSSAERYVIDQASVSYAISFSVLREMLKRRLPSTSRRAPLLVAFGNPSLGSDVLERVQRTYTGLRFAGTGISELDKLQTIYGPARTRAYTTTGANKERLKSEINTATVLHLALPAILDQSVPLYSMFLMSPETRDDGLLKLWEITSLNSKARIVVLPHAWPAGNSQTGAALAAMSWAWFVAGTPAVVLNRWEGNSAEFLSELHQRLKMTEPNSEQLRQAALKLRRTSTPARWANYMYLGY